MSKTLRQLAQGFVEAINRGEADRFPQLFAEQAQVDDAGREFRGREAIATWAATDIFAPQVSLRVLEIVERGGEASLVTLVDGKFDRTGLPDPVVIEQRITGRDGQIVALRCRLLADLVL